VTETWEDERGRFWAEHAAWFSSLFADVERLVVDAADFRVGERVLDVGCGCGDITIAAAEAVGPTGSVLAVDLSADELDVTLARAAHRDLANVEVRRADAGVDDLGPDPADVLVSRFGVMFFEDPVAAFTHLRAALAPDARLAFACWQAVDRNEWISVAADAIGSVLPLDPPPAPGTPGGSAFADPDHVRAVLGGAGFTDIAVEGAEPTIHLGDAVEDAIAFLGHMDYARSVLSRATETEVDEALDAVRRAVVDRAGPDGRIDLGGAIWLVRARA
jgi:SAM-dependent methyltransferase